MEMLTQAQAVATVTELQDGERACFWRESRFDRLECLSATFTRHVYAPHTHETYVLGTIEAGCETYRIRGRQEYASVGDLCMVNPDEVHDGAPCGEGYSYRMIYPSVALIQQIASDILDRPVTATPFFRYAKVHDPELSARFSRLHRLLEASGNRLEQDEAMHGVFATALQRHADLEPRREPGREHAAVARVRDHLLDRWNEDTDLDALSAVAGLTRHHLLRAFRRETGLTPHGFQTDIRVRNARRMLAHGDAPAEVAAACGFYDQSHLNRLFKARFGVTPGVFRSGGRG